MKKIPYFLAASLAFIQPAAADESEKIEGCLVTKTQPAEHVKVKENNVTFAIKNGDKELTYTVNQLNGGMSIERAHYTLEKDTSKIFNIVLSDGGYVPSDIIMPVEKTEVRHVDEVTPYDKMEDGERKLAGDILACAKLFSKHL